MSWSVMDFRRVWWDWVKYFLMVWIILDGSTLVGCEFHCDPSLVHFCGFLNKYFNSFCFLCTMDPPKQVFLKKLQWRFLPLSTLRYLSSLAWAHLWLLFRDGLLKGVTFQRVHFVFYFFFICSMVVYCSLDFFLLRVYFLTLYIFKWHTHFKKLKYIWCCKYIQ